MLQIIKDEFDELAFLMLVNGISHPIEYAKVLIQVKYIQSINYLEDDRKFIIFIYNNRSDTNRFHHDRQLLYLDNRL